MNRFAACSLSRALSRPLARHLRTAALPALLAAASLHASAGPATWVTSWLAAPQPTWAPGFVLPTNLPPVLQDSTLRQVARISLGGPRVRVVLSNAYGRQVLTVGAARVALSAGASAVQPGTQRVLRFGGREGVRIPPGAQATSDPVDLPVPALSRLAISLHLPGPTPVSTFHWDGRQTAWITPGDRTAAADTGTGSRTTTARAVLAAVQVQAPAGTRSVVAIGDSITDGNGATIDADTRWPDALAERLAPQGIAVLNAGISGARLLRDGMGRSVLARFERDVLAQPGVRAVVVLAGINDIAWPGTAFDPAGRPPQLQALADGYRRLAKLARARGVRIVAGTLTPFEDALAATPLEGYHTPPKEVLRQSVNAWIRSSGSGSTFDAVADFDALLRDPAHPARLLPAFDSGDHLHPGDAGNRAMAGAVGEELLGLRPSTAIRSTP